MAATVSDPSVPRSLRDGRYIWRRHLADGGTASVHLYDDIHTNIPVAVKLLHARILKRLRNGAERFVAEAQALSRLRDPHVVPVYAAGKDDGHLWYAMEYAEQGTLEDAVRRQPRIPPLRAARWVFETLMGLRAVHDAGMLHRDIKPSNLMLTAEHTVRIGDFGLARHRASEVPFRTESGIAMGSHGFAAPELYHNAKHADERADLHAAAATLFQLLSGRRPGALIFLHVDDRIMANVPVAFRDLVLTGISKSPDDRWSDAYSMAHALVEATATWCAHIDHPLDPHTWWADWFGETPSLWQRVRRWFGD
ncbi:MAG: serine/threonine protein kinase [Myxococcales bacterium]|nr:serine/threonine protein kinase [Myxococcales bacterium]